jgi:hypothetical protein
MVSDEFLKMIAQADEHMQVKSVQEVYLDFFIINSNLFHLGVESCLSKS